MLRTVGALLLVTWGMLLATGALAYAQEAAPASTPSGEGATAGAAGGVPTAPPAIDATPARPAAPNSAPPAYDGKPVTPQTARDTAVAVPSPVVPPPPRPQAADPDVPAVHPYQPPPLSMTTESYGGEIVLGDLAGLVLAVVIVNTTSPSGAGRFAGLPYLLASPVIHGVHGHAGLAVGGLFVHVIAPLVGAFGGFLIDTATCDSGEEFCGLAGLVLGSAAGVIGATVIDAAVLAQDVPVVAASARVAFTPTFSVARTGGALAGIAGRF